MNTSRGFLQITYKLYHHLDILDGEVKSTCLNVFLSVMKYCWKKNGYKAGLRHSSIEKDTKLSRATVKRCLETLNKLNIIKSIRGKSGKTYIVNEVFLKAEKLYEKTEIAHRYTQDSSLRATLEEHTPVYTDENNISKIVKGLAGNKEKIIEELSKLPVNELKEDKTNVYYCKLALDHKEQYENKNYVSSDKILSALKKIGKMSNPRYREKVEFNKRNSLDWKGRPIAKDKD